MRKTAFKLSCVRARKVETAEDLKLNPKPYKPTTLKQQNL